jgi:multiple sugar transport system substrate-binding protein
MVRTIAAMREMYEAGAFPEAFVTTLKEDQNTWMQQGRVAMCITPMGRNTLFNDPEKSLYSGRIKTIAIPSSPDIKAQFPVAPANVEMWNMVIPRASKRKEQAWDFIRNLISPQNVLKAALNGNGPIRASTYQDAAYNVSYAQEEGKALAVSRPPMPAFDNSARADDMFVEAFQSALLGMQEPQEAMDNLTAEVTQLMPS